MTINVGGNKVTNSSFFPIVIFAHYQRQAHTLNFSFKTLQMHCTEWPFIYVETGKSRFFLFTENHCEIVVLYYY